MISRGAAALLFVLLVFTVISPAAEAKPEFFQRIPANYQKSCNLCHVAPPILNDFGQEFKASGFSFEKLEARKNSRQADGGLAVAETKPENVPRDKLTTLKLLLPEKSMRGELLEIKARLADEFGKPIPGAPVSFLVPTSFFIEGDAFISQPLTNNDGIASIRYTPKLDGQIQIKARYAGGNGYRSTEVKGDLGLQGSTPPYDPDWRLRIPLFTPWLILLAVSIIWIAYGFTYGHLIAIRLESFSTGTANHGIQQKEL